MDFKNRFNQKYKDNPNVFGTRPMPVLEKALEYISGGTALDLGVGNGRNALYLLSKNFDVTGVDMSEEGIELLRKRVPEGSKLKLVVSSVLDFETDKKFDLVCAIGLLHFLNIEDINKLIIKMKELTKDDGINVIAARMTQNLRQDLLLVFKPNELKNFYMEGDWEIKEYQEMDRGRAKLASLIVQKQETRIP